MPTLASVTLNPGSGGSSVTTDQQSTGVQMPISELAVAPGDGRDAQPVTYTNPSPVLDTGVVLTLSAILVELRAIRALLAAQSGQFTSTHNDV